MENSEISTGFLKTFLAQEMRGLREKKTTTEVAKTQATLASQLNRAIESEHKLARAISKAPNIESILKKLRDENYSLSEK